MFLKHTLKCLNYHNQRLLQTCGSATTKSAVTHACVQDNHKKKRLSNCTLSSAGFYLLEWHGALGFFTLGICHDLGTGKEQSRWPKGHKPFCPALIIAQAFVQHPFVIALLPHFHYVF